MEAAAASERSGREGGGGRKPLLRFKAIIAKDRGGEREREKEKGTQSGTTGESLLDPTAASQKMS